jgi:hypothetical protein
MFSNRFMSRSFRRLPADPRLFLEPETTFFDFELPTQPGVFSLKLFDAFVVSASSRRRSWGRLTQPFKTVLGHLPTQLKQLPGIQLLMA